MKIETPNGFFIHCDEKEFETVLKILNKTEEQIISQTSKAVGSFLDHVDEISENDAKLEVPVSENKRTIQIHLSTSVPYDWFALRSWLHRNTTIDHKCGPSKLRNCLILNNIPGPSGHCNWNSNMAIYAQKKFGWRKLNKNDNISVIS